MRQGSAQCPSQRCHARMAGCCRCCCGQTHCVKPACLHCLHVCPQLLQVPAQVAGLAAGWVTPCPAVCIRGGRLVEAMVASSGPRVPRVPPRAAANCGSCLSPGPTLQRDFLLGGTCFEKSCGSLDKGLHLNAALLKGMSWLPHCRSAGCRVPLASPAR